MNFEKIESLFEEDKTTKKLVVNYAIKLRLKNPQFTSLMEIKNIDVDNDLNNAIKWFNAVNDTRQILDYKIYKDNIDILLIFACDKKYDNNTLSKKIGPLSKYLYQKKEWSKLVNNSGRLFSLTIKLIPDTIK